jgi:hypothetical protein
MSIQGGFSQTVQFTGLVETDIGVPDTATYNVDVKLQIPSRVQSGSDSAVVVVIKKNSTTEYTGTAGATGAWVQIACSAGDTIKVITSSSNAIDEAINAVQGTIAISEGIGGY